MLACHSQSRAAASGRGERGESAAILPRTPSCPTHTHTSQTRQMTTRQRGTTRELPCRQAFARGGVAAQQQHGRPMPPSCFPIFTATQRNEAPKQQLLTSPDTPHVLSACCPSPCVQARVDPGHRAQQDRLARGVLYRAAACGCGGGAV